MHLMLYILFIILISIDLTNGFGFAIPALCKVLKSFSRTFDIKGYHFRLFPYNLCSSIKAENIIFQVFPYYKESKNTSYERITAHDNNERLRTMFNSTLPTAIFIPGFFDGESSPSIRALKAAFLQRYDYNYVNVLWKELAVGPWYPTAAKNIYPVGLEVAKLIDRLVYSGAIQLKGLHLIGFSLGAHVSGVAANHITSGRVPRITGLDPAYPLFTDTERPLYERLNKEDAEFVDVIHTTAGYLGIPDSIGHADFYPNSGRSIQPGCERVLSIGSCSHWRSFRFFEESLRGGKFISTKCNNWINYVNKKCIGNHTTQMGMDVDLNARGKYYLRTNWAAPYSIS